MTSTRRSFFAQLAGGLVALKSGKALAALAASKMVVNPAWVNAPYEVVFSCAPGSFKRLVPSNYRGVSFAPDPWPLRLNYQGEVVEHFIGT